jgi:hypothetical protein
MASALSQGCIPANPEIAGIGIRASIYAQNFLAVFLAACYLMDNELSQDEVDYMESSSSANLITGCAMIISGFIQAKTIGLSVYHAMIVLNLSWMNTTFSVISAAFACLTDWLDRGLENKRKGPRIGYLGIIHLSLTGSFGVWVWREVDKFGDSPECTPYLFTVFFGHDVSVLAKPLRRVYLIVFWVTAIPIVNILMVAIVTSIGAMVALLCLVSPLILLAYILDRCLSRHSKKSHANDANAVQGIPITLTKHGLSLRGWVAKRVIRVGLPYLCFVAFIDVFFTIDTELLVRRNQQFVQPGESQWTFGQTLAVIVAITPLWEARKCLKQMKSARCVSSFLEAPMNRFPNLFYIQTVQASPNEERFFGLPRKCYFDRRTANQWRKHHHEGNDCH